MNSVQVIPTLLLASLTLVMFGVGLSLCVADFKRLLDHPKAVAVALLLQVVLLPVACYGISVAFGLSPIYAVGLMLLAASPGGVSANLFSHVFGGNVAMNVSLTAINTMLSIVSMPLIANWSIQHFAKTDQVIPLQLGKLIEVIAVILIPVIIGMAIAARKPDAAKRLEKSFKVFSAIVLATFAAIAIYREWGALLASFASIGSAVICFNLVSLMSGYYVSRGTGLDRPLASAIAFEIGIHNSTLSMYIALSVLNNAPLALPSALYSVFMYLTATLFGLYVLRRGLPAPEMRASQADPIAGEVP